MLPLASTTSWTLFLAGMLMLIFMLLRRSRTYYRRARRDAKAPGRPAASGRSNDPYRDAPVDVIRWQVAMHDTARDLKGELDSKMLALQVLVQRAEVATRGLEAAIERAVQLGVSADRGDRLERIARCQEGNAWQVPPAAELPADAGQRTRVYALADAGQTPPAIASHLGLPVGDVELILSLR